MRFKFFKGCLPQISLDPFLNTLPHMLLCQPLGRDKFFFPSKSWKQDAKRLF